MFYEWFYEYKSSSKYVNDDDCCVLLLLLRLYWLVSFGDDADLLLVSCGLAASIWVRHPSDLFESFPKGSLLSTFTFQFSHLKEFGKGEGGTAKIVKIVNTFYIHT